MKIYLDLLPRERKQELKRKKIFRLILRQEFLFLLPVAALVVVLFNILYLLSFELSTPIRTEEQKKYQELDNYEERFRQVNETTAELLKIQAGHLAWSNVFEKMDTVTPDGVVISNLNTKDYAVFLVGKARSRDILLEFKSNLESTECFWEVNVPLSNLVSKEDVDFQIDFSVNEDCLKKKI